MISAEITAHPNTTTSANAQPIDRVVYVFVEVREIQTQFLCFRGPLSAGSEVQRGKRNVGVIEPAVLREVFVREVWWKVPDTHPEHPRRGAVAK